MDASRASGIILHPTSLPGKYGIGDLGPKAYMFVDFLSEAKQSLWQILPLGQPSYGNSPYMSLSAFGGNPYLISPEKLVEDELLSSTDIENPPAFPTGRVDYDRAIRHKMDLLSKSFEVFEERYSPSYPDDFLEFTQSNDFWLDDYALFESLKEAHNGIVWTKWEEGAANRIPDSLLAWRQKLAADIQFRKYLQYQFFKQWFELKEYCQKNGIQIIGDIPVYVAHDSAEVWARRTQFQLDERGDPSVIAGVPPDYFSITGQRWGNPIYNWDTMAQDGYSWWIERFRANLMMFDTVRLDHFRGFEAYWEIPASEPTAVNGKWVKGPGAELFNAIKAELGDIRVIAEDLGVITPEVDNLRDEMGFPGMRILQMAFGKDAKSMQYRPHNYIWNCVVYTATHDHNTTIGWFTAPPGTQSTQSAEEVHRERDQVLKYLGTNGSEINWDFIRLAMRSVARFAIFPLQDVLGLGTESRMNLPGTPKGNWEWRFTEDMLKPEVITRLSEMSDIYERNP